MLTANNRKKFKIFLGTGKDRSAIDFSAHFRHARCDYTNTNVKDLNIISFKVDQTKPHGSCQPCG